MTRRKFLEKLRKEIPYIKTHEEDDWDWYNEGIEFLKKGEIEKAEKKFKELILSQPEHHDGYEGLARVYMEKGRLEEALFLMNEAIKFAERFLEDGSLDIEVLDELKELREEIKGKIRLI
jgi:tetratricopeptide (TPR) repeat protein